jgi:hypothetical protein
LNCDFENGRKTLKTKLQRKCFDLLFKGENEEINEVKDEFE